MNTDQRSVAQLNASSDLANLRPLHDQVLVRLEEEPEQQGAIYVPATARNKGNRTAVVVAAGKDSADLVSVGDRVLLGPDPGWELPDGHRMLRIGAVLAVLSNDACNCDPLAQTGGGHATSCPEYTPECTCYEGPGHQPGCYFNRRLDLR